MGNSGSRRREAAAAPPLDPAREAAWLARMEPTRARMWEQCLTVEQYPYLTSLMEVVDKDDVPYAQSFMAGLREHIEENDTDNFLYGVLGDRFEDHLEVHAGSTKPLGGDQYMMYIPFSCKPAEAKANARNVMSNEFYGMKAKEFLTRTAPQEATAFWQYVYYPFKAYLMGGDITTLCMADFTRKTVFQIKPEPPYPPAPSV